MDSIEFKRLRKNLTKTQKQMAQLLGVSLKAVHSYEQGWRTIPPAVERQMYFLASRAAPAAEFRPCWELMDCPEDFRLNMPGLGVQERGSLLVHQRDHLRRRQPPHMV